MADNIAGRLFVEILPDVDRRDFQSAINKAAAGARVQVPGVIDIAKSSIADAVAQANARLSAAKNPKITVDVEVDKKDLATAMSAAKQVADQNALYQKNLTSKIRTEHKHRGQIAETYYSKELKRVDAQHKKLSKRSAIQAAKETTTIIVNHKYRDKLADIAYAKELTKWDALWEKKDKVVALHSAKQAATIVVNNRYADQLAETAAKKRAAALAVDAANASKIQAIEQAKTGARLDAAQERRLDQRSLIEQRAVVQRQLINLRAAKQLELIDARSNAKISRSRTTTLRLLRNDLNSFDITSTRMLRRLSVGFGLFTAGVVTSFAAIAVASLRSFAQTEVQLRRTAAVLGTDAFTQAAANGEDAFAAFGKRVEEVGGQLQNVVNTAALRTVFDPTETARGARALAQAGAQVDDIKASLLDIARFAQNEEILPEEAVQQLVQGATAAGMSISEINSLADKFTFVANNTTASAKEVADAFANRAAPAFRAYGQSVDQTLTVLNLFAAAGIKGKTAGEQTGILIREINKAATKTPKTIAAFQKYGIQVGRVNGKNIEFTTTLSQLANQFEKVRAEKGSQGLALLRKELGLTEKSGAGLIQILPQITDLQLSGLQNVTKQIEKSRGAVTRQADVLTQTLSFQTEQFGNQVTALFKTAAGPLAKGLTTIFLRLNGEIEGTSSITDRLSSKFDEVGQRIAKVLIPSLRRFAFGGEGEAFISGLRDLYAGTLVGLRNAFIEFRRAAFGEQDGRGFFSVLGDTFALIGDFSRSTLPRLGRLFGTITGFVNDNQRAIKLLIATWAGTFVFSKTLRLAVIPASNLLDQIGGLNKAIKAIAASKFVLWLTDSIRGMRGLAAATKSATAATAALAAAQASTAAAGGISAATAGVGIGTAAASQASKLQSIGKIAGTALVAGFALPLKALKLPLKMPAAAFKGVSLVISGIVKSIGGLKNTGSVIKSIVSGIAKFAKLAGPIGLIVVAIEAAIGFVRGFVNELTRGGDKNKEFSNSLKEIKPILDFVIESLKTLGKVVFDTLGVVFRLGEALGKWAAGGIRSAVVIVGDFVRIFKELAKGNFGNAFKALGDVILNSLLAPGKLFIAFILDAISAIIASGRSIPGIGKYFDSWAESLNKTAARIRDWNINLIGAKDAVEKTKSSVIAAKSSVDSYSQSIGVLGVQTVLAHQRSTVFADRNKNVAAVLGIVANRAKNAANYQLVLSRASRNASVNMVLLAGNRRRLNALFTMAVNGSKKATESLVELRTASIILARDNSIQKLTEDHLKLAGSIRIARNEEYLLAVQRVRTNASKRLKAVRQDISAELESMRNEINSMASAGGIGLDGMGGIGDAATESAKEVKTAAEQATEAVNKLSQAQLNKQAGALVAKVTRAAAKGYQATAVEAEILRRTLPAVEAQLQRQQDAVAKLDQALQDLQSTQLKGTKAFSDQAFAVEQGIKKLQLQRLDLIIAGTPEEDSAIKALDDQIAKLQQSSERLSLVESLKLDPLRRKLEQTFNPVKELTFDEIIKQFNAIQKQRAPLTDAIAGGENLKATLETAIKDAEARFGDAGRQVTAGFAIGIKGATPQVTQAGKTAGNAALAGVNNVMKFGSPSRTMIERGLWVSEGFVQGINAGSSMITSAGVTAMFSFLTGMRNVYENRIQPFIRSIAVWIKENKGPVSYDATLLRPAGEAMMQGFHRGLRDGFNEVKTWVSDVGPDLARHTIPDKIFKKMSAEFLISNASADMAFDPGEFFASITPMGEVGVGANFLGQSLGLDDTIKQAQMIARMFGITPNISSARRRFGDPAYNAAIGGAANSLHIAGRAMDFTGSDAGLTNAANWARKYMEMVFQEVLWKTTGHYDHLHLGWKYGNKKLIADIAGASRVVEEALANAANLTKVDFNLLAAIAKAESGFNPNVVSSAGAGGLMQLMPGTARSLGVTNVFDPKQNALGGAKYIKQMLENFNGNTRIALAAYNAGPGNAMIAMRQFGETIAYIEKVMRYFNQFKSGNYRAQGGKVNSMTPYIVGERGQELFVPSQNGSVISNKDLRDLISALSGAKPGTATGTTINDNRRFEVISNSTDPATVAALVDARIRSQVVGVRR